MPISKCSIDQEDNNVCKHLVWLHEIASSDVYDIIYQ